MASKKADYIYKTQNDQFRICIYKTDRGEWDFRVFDRMGGEVFSYCIKGATSYFRTKRGAKATATGLYGELTSINPETATEGWEEN